ncbi:GNAT family N-acetyltransferase [Nocardioides montaniterrae]
MRLTHVGHIRLPFGRLWGYDVTAGPPGDTVDISFDQGRHVGSGDRAGSWMALSFQLSAPVDRDLLAAAWLAVIARHGTLRTRFALGADGEPTLHTIDVTPGAWTEHEIAAGESANDAVRRVLDERCRPLSAPSHRLCVVETATAPTIVIAADHSHVDMWSLLVLGRDLLIGLDQARAGSEPSLPPAPAFAEHTRALTERPAAPDDVHQTWARVIDASGGVMPRFPLDLGDVTAPVAERVELRDVLDVDDSAAFAAQARADGVSTLALVIAAMAAVTENLAQQPLRALFPVHSRYDETWHDSVGWFITNSVIECTDSTPATAAAAVKDAIRLGSWPLAEVLAPWGGMPTAPGMFAISWLDLRRLPVRFDSVGMQAHYVSAALKTDGVMIWFILDEAGLHLRCRYPDTVQARTSVGRWLDALVDRLGRQARTSAGGRLDAADGSLLLQRATRSDAPAIARLLADDVLGRRREGDDVARYEAAYDAISRDPAHYLAVVRDEAGQVVATMQLSLIPGLSRHGATRLQIEGLRVDPAWRGRGVGSTMMAWAHEHGRARGAVLAQITTDRERDRALSFYAGLGYQHSQVGLKRAL